MWRIFVVIFALSACEPVYAADINKALFGWDTKSGVHINGTFGNEGGYQNLPGDSGNFRNGKNCGGTNYGITCRDHPGVDVKHLTKAGAAKIYHDNEWAAVDGDHIISQYLAYKVNDLAINMGGAGVEVYEKTVNDLNGKAADWPLKGRVTPEMTAWVNWYTAPAMMADGTISNEARWHFFDHLKLQAMKRYISLAQHNPKLRQFLLTWSSRDVNDE